jgi:hypothetical protein
MKKDDRAALKIFALIAFVYLVFWLTGDYLDQLLDIPLIFQIPLVAIIGWGGFFLVVRIASKLDN